MTAWLFSPPRLLALFTVCIRLLLDRIFHLVGCYEITAPSCCCGIFKRQPHGPRFEEKTREEVSWPRLRASTRELSSSGAFCLRAYPYPLRSLHGFNPSKRVVGLQVLKTSARLRCRCPHKSLPLATGQTVLCTQHKFQTRMENLPSAENWVSVLAGKNGS